MARTKATVRKFAEGGKDRKKMRFRPGTVAKREIKRYQIGKKATITLVPKAAMDRLVRELTQGLGDEIRFKGDAIEALQQAAEDFLVDMFKKSDVIRQHCKRETMSVEDLQCVKRLLLDMQ